MKLLKRRYPSWSKYPAMLILPVISYYLMEGINHNPFTIPFILQLFGWLVCWIITGFLVFLTGHSRWALLLEEFLIFFISFANEFVLTSRGSPILPWDLASIGIALTVAGEYSFEITLRIVIIAAAWLLLFLVTLPVNFKLHRSIGHRITGMLSAVFLTIILIFGLQQQFIDDFLNIYEMPFTQNVTYRKNGFFVSFLVNMKYLNVDKPSGYSKGAAESLLEKYTPEDETSGDEAAAAEDLPNIIVIMNEAFSDLSVIGDFTTNEEYLAYFNSLKGTENTISGSLYVSVLGGNTANTEFEFLTGNTMAFLPTGSIPYQQYIKHDLEALPEILSSYGYETLALHPYNASGWRRNVIYPLLGFDDMMFNVDFQYKKRMRTYITDESAFKQVIAEYEDRSGDSPFFSFLVTMQNHGGYAKEWTDFTREVQVTGSSIANLKRINAYLTCIQKTDEAFRELIKYFENTNEKTIILMFGDHQPNVETSFIESLYGKSTDELTDEELSLRYQTPFLLWANYDIDEAEGISISANYLSSLLMDTAGLPKTAYQNYLSELNHILPVLTANFAIDADGKFYSTYDSRELNKVLGNYKLLQYYELFGRK